MISDLLQRLASFLDRPLFPWKKLIIGFSLGEFALENWLLYRQYRVLSRNTRPKALSEEVSQETYEKSQKYGRAKAQYGFISSIFQQAKNLATIHFDLFPKVWAITGLLLVNYFPVRLHGEVTHSLVFIFAMSFFDLLFNLPFSYYHTFVLEESFGFNKTTMNTWVADIFKGQALSIAFGVPLGAAFLKIIQKTGQSFFYYLWVFMLVVQVSAITVYPILIVPIFNKLTPLKPGPLKQSVEALASKLKFPLGELQVIDGSKRSAHSNAYFTGMPWKKRIVIYDTLLEKSSDQEVTAVLAHELGHWQMGHTSKLLIISQVHTFYLFALFSAFVNNTSVYQSFGFYKEQPIIIGFLLFSSILSPTDSVIKLLMNMLTRSMEYEADAFAVKLGYTTELAASLIKLQITNLSSMDADWMYSSFHYSHPILTERLRAMGWTGENGPVSKDSDQVRAEKASGREL
ncbi:CaaX prenyl protease-like protein [Pseudovirgaria hyperparasitica]|uniref:CAAX prenyl protease n=1 Tax=Pseudovirgaria hyperparasitica TaxID=470096 RepID=A0A6A6VU85_9PEZI|nr:CaaX prenyl protease-like protein [Pseudovirgaria hyperparasitica]KAF2752807.1 CaaX prenyl protease-like protein [Pseudovirgaria hyperparasitica]